MGVDHGRIIDCKVISLGQVDDQAFTVGIFKDAATNTLQIVFEANKIPIDKISDIPIILKSLNIYYVGAIQFVFGVISDWESCKDENENIGV